MLAFACLLVSELKGSMYSCFNTSISNITLNTECFDYGGDWVVQDQNFDNVLLALSNLFQLSTVNTWSTPWLWQTQKSVYYICIFIFFILIFKLHFLRFFTAVIVRIYTKLRTQRLGFESLTSSQREFVLSQHYIITKRHN